MFADVVVVVIGFALQDSAYLDYMVANRLVCKCVCVRARVRLSRAHLICLINVARRTTWKFELRVRPEYAMIRDFRRTRGEIW